MTLSLRGMTDAAKTAAAPVRVDCIIEKENGLTASAAEATPGMKEKQSPSFQDVAYHWFYRALKSDESSPDQWKPFTMIDSGAIEDKFTTNPEDQEPVPTDGGRYDVSIADRTKKAVYWPEEALPIRRCSWFFR